MPHDHAHLWRQHESVLRDLYQVKRLSLDQVKQVMESKHGFPLIPLSVYETRLRDQLGLRKKLRKTDWPSIYGHYLEQQQSGDVAIYFHGTRIPWKKAWKEIRRTGAHLSTQGHNDPLPAGVVLRSPSHALAPSIPELDSARSVQTLSSSPRQLSDSRIMELPLRGTMCKSFPHHFRVPKSQISPGWQESCLGSLPWNRWIQETQSLISTTSGSRSLQTTTTFMEFLGLSSPSGNLSQRTPQHILHSYRQNSNSRGQLSPHFDVFHFLAELIYKMSNKTFGTKDTTPVGSRGLLLGLSSRIPISALNALFNCEFPSVHASWETLIFMRVDESGRDDFAYLMQVGLRHKNWVFPRRNDLLARAAYHGCADMIRRLLSLGARPDVPIHPIGVRVDRKRGWFKEARSAVAVAARQGHINCARLLIDHCDVNKPLLIEGNFHHPPYSASNFVIYIDWVAQTQDGNEPALLEVLEMFLAAGADVDAPLPHQMMNRDLFNFHVANGIPEQWHYTCLDWAFHGNPEFFQLMITRSKIPCHQISRIKLLEAATRGSEAMKAYLEGIYPCDPAEVANFLELFLAELFVCRCNCPGVLVDSALLGDRCRRRLKKVRAFIELGVDIRLPSLNATIQDVLYQAVSMADESSADVLRHILSQGAQIDAIAMKNAVPQNKTSGLGRLPILGQLGADWKRLGGLAVSEACVEHNWEAFEWLLSAGVDLNASVPGPHGTSTVISLVCSGAKWSFSNAFYEGGSSSWATPKNDMVRRLIEAGAELRSSPHDDDPRIFLKEQIISIYFDGDNYLERILMFLDAGPDLRNPSTAKYGLLEACRSMYPLVRDTGLSLFEVLYRRGVPICTGDLAVLVSLRPRYDLVEELINAGADVNAYARPRVVPEGRGYAAICGGFSPIQAAAKHDESIVSLLLQKGADINQPAYPERGETALQAACIMQVSGESEKERQKRRLQMIKFLIDHGADANAPPAMTGGRTALLLAMHFGELEHVLLLLDHGADPNAPTSSDQPYRTALDDAGGRLDLIQLLLNQGGRSSYEGRTGFDEAITSAINSGSIAAARHLWGHAETLAQLKGDVLYRCDGCLLPKCSGCLIPEGNLSSSSKL